MKPYYQDDHVTIYHGDCREILPHLEVVDLVLTDPPYGLGDRWSGGGSWQHHKGIYADAKRWDREPPSAETFALILKGSPVQIIWGGNYFCLPPSRCWLAWEKVEKMYTIADFELAWTSMDKPAKMYTARRNPDGRRSHPTQKPLGLMKWCIKQANGTATTILDPFMGSGTTLRAAKDLGRKAIGIEIEEAYCEIAARRLEQQVLSFGEDEEPLHERKESRQLPVFDVVTDPADGK